MDDPLSTIRSLRDAHVVQEKQLRLAFVELADRIAESVTGADVHVVGENTVLDEYGDDECYYGSLSFNNGELTVAYRTTENDLEDSVQQYPDRTSCSAREIQDCPFKWLRAVAQERIIASFFKAIIAKLDEQKREAETGLQTVTNALNAPIRDAAAALEVAADKMGYQDVVRDWHDAQASVFTDPREAITRASSLIETVCKHILDAKSTPLPLNQDIQQLSKKTLGLLNLASDTQTSRDLQQIAGSVAHGVGTLRTHVGTAHGRPPGSPQPNHIQARFVLTMAGAVSTFLMEVLDSMKTTVKNEI